MTAPDRPQKSTIVRPGGVRRGLTRAAFGVLDRVAPPLGARWALDIWCTLPDNSGRRRDERPRPGERSTVPMPGEQRLAVETWGYGPPVYLVHGWGGWRGQLGAFVSPLVEAGRRVVAFDAPGHGDSGPGTLGPGRGSAVEFADAFAAVTRVHGAAAGVVAHSLGCATTALAVRDGALADRLAFVAPSPDPIGMTDDLARTLGYGERTKTRFAARLERLAGRPLTDFDLGATARATALPPAMIVHDENDKEVPYEQAVGLAAAWPAAEFVTTRGLGHQRILRDAETIKLVVDYVVA